MKLYLEKLCGYISYLYLNKSDKICKSFNFFLISLSSYFSLVMCKIDDVNIMVLYVRCQRVMRLVFGCIFLSTCILVISKDQ